MAKLPPSPQSPDFSPVPASSIPTPPPDRDLQDPFRRVLLRTLGLGGLSLLVEGISGGMISKAISRKEKEDSEGLHEAAEAVATQMEAAASEHLARVEQVHPELSEGEKAVRVVDYLGATLFAWGVSDLLRGGHIKQVHYAALTLLLAAKHQLSDEDGKHHLETEIHEVAKAYGIIGGTIVLAEGVRMDVAKAYEAAAKRPMTQRDKVALMTMLGGALSPIATTVGSASIVKPISLELSNGDPRLMAVCVSHVSNLSGFLLLGDPPFIAVNELYGPAEGFKWQARTMWPLALYSLLSSTYKINLVLAQRDGLGGIEAHQQALSESIQGLRDNVGVLALIMAKSAANFFHTIGFSKYQDETALAFRIDDVLQNLLKNLAKLPWSPDLDAPHHHEEKQGMTGSQDEAFEALNALLGQEVRDASSSLTESNYAAFAKAINDQDFESARRIGREEMGLATIDNMLRPLEELAQQRAHGRQPGHPETLDLKDTLNPINLYNRTFDINRMKGALGHNLGDVTDVFIFQGLSVPFLKPVFEDIVHGLESLGLGEQTREIAMFFLIMMFSSIADNYVACKIGLQLFSNKPEVPLIASIIGGSLSAVGNMANVAQFSLDQFPLGKSFAMARWHLDNVAVGLIWSQILSHLQDNPALNLLFGSAPTPLAR